MLLLAKLSETRGEASGGNELVGEIDEPVEADDVCEDTESRALLPPLSTERCRCRRHSEIEPAAPRPELLQLATEQRTPPPCCTQKSVLPRAFLTQPVNLQVLPPPCRRQKLVLMAASRQSLKEQRLPPPWPAQWSEPPRAARGQPSVLQRVPPPWFLHHSVMPCASLPQTGTEQQRAKRLPPHFLRMPMTR